MSLFVGLGASLENTFLFQQRNTMNNPHDEIRESYPGQNLITVKTIKTKKYTVLDLTCIEDKTLSWKAKAIHTYLISRPDSWTVRKNDLLNRATDREDSLKSGIKELIEKGYVYRINKKDKRNRFIRWGFLVLESPSGVSDTIDMDGWKLYEKPEGENRLLENVGESNKKSGESPEGENRPPYYITEELYNNSSSPIFSSSLREEDSIGEEVPPMVAEASTTEDTKFVRMKRRKAPVPSTNQSYRERISEGILKNSKPPKKKYDIPKKRVTDFAEEIINYWEECGLRKIPPYEEKPKIFNDTIAILNAVTKGNSPFTRKYFLDEIKMSITKFSLCALDSSFEPSDPVLKRELSKLHLKDFLYNGFAKMKSWFLHFMNREPRRIIPLIEDKLPKSTSRVKKFYTDYVFGGIPQKYTDEEENKFRLASIRAKEFYDKNKYSLRGIQGFYPDVIDFLCEAVKEHWGEEVSKVSPGCFCSDFAMKKLQAYCQEQGVIEYRENSITD